jgi:hypothetical protein
VPPRLPSPNITRQRTPSLRLIPRSTRFDQTLAQTIGDRYVVPIMQVLEPGSPAEAGAGRGRQSDRDLTLGWVSGCESAVCKVKKEIPVNMTESSSNRTGSSTKLFDQREQLAKT